MGEGCGRRRDFGDGGCGTALEGDDYVPGLRIELISQAMWGTS